MAGAVLLRVALRIRPGQSRELIGAAQAFFSMFLSACLPRRASLLQASAPRQTFHIVRRPVISLIELNTEADVPASVKSVFQEQAEAAKKTVRFPKRSQVRRSS